ncbi:Tigger transposable element-derived protein 1 [Eumeta japonica]|uniref:Tigger transposable element-derived protein 1 n=1 Tax=Eumeta variegata TaxID=151549 RepID=A0A4C1T435_EUMVA|nr:Tigger transposable element-derived protein 1 [Eumeta japonica]
MKNTNERDLPVHSRSNKRAWMTATLFKDWLENCAVPELKRYCSSQQIEFKMLLLVDNAPGHPIFSDDLSEHVKVVFMPPNTTSLIQPMDQGVISNFKMYYLRRTFRQLLDSTDKNDQLSMKDFWKNYNIMKAIENIHLSWEEVKASSMKGSWRQLWPELVNGEEDVIIDDVPNVSNELANLAREAGSNGMEEGDINELLLSHDKELDNENLLAIDIQHVAEEDAIISNETLEEKKLTIANISKAMQLISHAMDILSENDSDENRSTGVAASVDRAIGCYKEIYQQKIFKNSTNFRHVC